MRPLGQITRETVDWYLSRGLRLMPLKDADADPKLRGKRPRYSDWTRKVISPDELYDAAARGYNLGWVIDENKAIFDIDVREGGEEGYERLCEDFPEIATDYVTVRTGGGRHIYVSCENSFDSVSKIIRYPGVDLRRHGSQCVIPGSFHYLANCLYRWESKPGVLAEFAPLPAALSRAYQRIDGGQPGQDQRLSPHLSSDDLEQLLHQIDVEDFAGNGAWFPLMCACHHATCGQGADAFVAWSMGDSRYAGQESMIRYRWRSLDGSKASLVTYASLLDTLYKHGGTLPVAVQAKIDFVDVPEMGEYHVSDVKTAEKVRRARDNWASLVDRVSALSEESGQQEIDLVISEVAGLSPVDRDRAITLIRRQTGRSATVIRQLISRAALAAQTKRAIKGDKGARAGIEVGEALTSDPAYFIALRVIDAHFDRGRLICVAPDGDLWHYNGTHWEPLPPMAINRYAVMAIERFAIDNPGTPVVTETLKRQAVNLVPAIVQYKGDLFHDADIEGYTVINCLSHEVWVENKSGIITPMSHSPESRQRGVLPIVYDPEAKCPLFHATLRDIFEPDTCRDETIRHLLELFGYTIQSYKNLASWVLFHGKGANGKTLLLRLLSHLLGERAASLAVRDLDGSKSSHALASLPGKLAVIDEDLETRDELPDSSLKKVSENKRLQANPKFKQPFDFDNTAICYMASNHWPYLRDVSHGMRRRAHVFDFKRVFAGAEKDDLRFDRLVSESSGILNEFIQGLQRLRERGDFKRPPSVQLAQDFWLQNSSQVFRFLSFYKTEEAAHNHAVPFTDLWESYQLWATEEGITKKFQRGVFRRALLTAGVGQYAGGKLDVSQFLNSKIFDSLLTSLPSQVIKYEEFKNKLKNKCAREGTKEYSDKAIRDLLERAGASVIRDRKRIDSIDLSWGS